MKKFFLLTTVMILSSLGFISCNKNEVASTNTAYTTHFNIEKNGEKVSDNDSFKKDFLKSITFKITPKKGNTFTKSNEEMGFTLPLLTNTEYTCKEEGCNSNYGDTKPEIFDIEIYSNGKKIFENKLKVDYRAGNPFATPVMGYEYEASTKTWKEYTSIKFPILDDKNQPTGYTFEYIYFGK